MPHSSSYDRILALGVAVERAQLEKLVIRIPSRPGYALYRQHGLQVIPDESLELDTGGSDIIIVSPKADVVSGVLLQIASALPCPAEGFDLGSFSQAAGNLLKAGAREAKADWELRALGRVVTAALDIANRLKTQSKTRSTRNPPRDPGPKRPRPPGPPPHIRQGLGDGERDIFPSAEEFSFAFGWPLGSGIQELDQMRLNRSEHLFVICGLAGKIVGNLWLPLPSRGVRITQKLIDRITSALVKKGVDPTYAQVILGEMLARGRKAWRR